jgi:predicted glycoside hydrolase/deacetylase ChbG (UPF0249 family)
MLIINADDWGRSKVETDAANDCYKQEAVTSVSAMVFMQDSERAAELARIEGMDVGLHVNFTQAFTGAVRSSRLQDYQNRVSRFLKRSKYALLIYHPFLRDEFRYIYQMQADEFIRLYGRPPSHIDGHQHMHLCSNVLIDGILPSEQKVRRSFSFCRDEKGAFNRAYRSLVDRWLERRYYLTDFFFSLKEHTSSARFARIVALARTAHVEVMTHPVNTSEYDFLVSDTYRKMVAGLQRGSYVSL